jgi:hypothetical protein
MSSLSSNRFALLMEDAFLMEDALNQASLVQVASSSNARETLSFAAIAAISTASTFGRDEDVCIQIEQPDVVIEIPVAQTEETTVEEEENTVPDEVIFEGLTEVFSEYSSMYTEQIAKSKVFCTPVYYLAIAMVCDLIAKLDEIKEKNSVFSKRVVKGLFSIPIMKNGEQVDSVNITSLLHSFVELGKNYAQYDFNDSTIGTYCGKSRSKNFDINYHLTHTESDLTVGDCNNRFVVLFKAFRTSVAHIINRCTGTYNPTATDFENASYTIRNKSGSDIEKKWSPEFANFINELGDIYTELEKLPKNLSCIGEVFASAKKEVAELREKKQAMREKREMQQQLREMKNFKKNFQDRQTERSRHYKEKINTKATVTVPEPVKPAPVVNRAPIAAPIKWGGYNPVTQTSAPVFVPKASAPAFVPQVSAPVIVPEEFTTVQRRSRFKPTQTEAPFTEGLTGKARKIERARLWKENK